MRVREAHDADDLQLLLEWTARRHVGSVYGAVPFSPLRAAGLLAKLMHRSDGLLAIAEHEGRPVAGLGGEIVNSAFTEARIATLWSLYADEGYGAAALPLLRYYVRWARTRGARLVEANNSRSMDDERFTRLLVRVGFARSGSHMHLEV